METTKENLKEKIRVIALRNLSQEPTLMLEKQKLVELYSELAKLRDQYKSIRGQYGRIFQCVFFCHRNVSIFVDDQTGEMSPEMIYIILQSAAADFERQTEV